MEINYAGLFGLYGGLLCGVLGSYYGKKKAGGRDEVRDYIFKTARSFSWYVTIVTIYVLFNLFIIGIELSLSATLGILMMVLFSSWGISAALLSYYYSVEKKPNINFWMGLFLIIIPAILFVAIAILVENWIFLFCPIPLSIVGVYMIKLGQETEGGEHS